jgi:hypothetical protein
MGEPPSSVSGLKACTGAEISRTICELLEWKRANGGLKNNEYRQLLAAALMLVIYVLWLRFSSQFQSWG